MARKPALTGQDAVSEIGVSGLRQYSGYIREEFLRDLQGPKAARVYREMAENDAVIGATLFAIEMLLRTVEWRIEPVDPDMPEDVAAAALCAEAKDGLSQSWVELIAEIMSFLAYGWSLVEQVYRIDGGRLVWDRFSPRAQDSLLRWEFGEADTLLGMWQQKPSGGQVFIPIEKALLFRTTSRKNSPEGRSILRTAYRAWYFKKRIEEIEGIGIERDLAGLPVAYVPAEWTGPNAAPQQRALYNEVRNIVRNIRRDEQEGLVLPSIFAESADGSPGERLLKVELLSTGGRRQFDTNAIVQRYDQRIAMTVLADFILLGHEKVGSFALSSDKTDLFAVAIGAWLSTIKGQFDTRAIPQLLRLNGMPGRCTLEHSDIEDVDFSRMAEAINKLVGAGVLRPDDALEDHLRERMHLPQVEDARSREFDDAGDPDRENAPPQGAAFRNRAADSPPDPAA